MSEKRPTKTWTRRDRLKMIALLETFQLPGFQYRTYGGGQVRMEDGVETISMPYSDYHPVNSEFWDLAYQTSCWLNPYEGDEDWGDFWQRFEGKPSEFRNATIEDIRRYLVLMTRGERFCDGLIGSEYECGSFPAALHRLKELTIAL